MSYPIISLKFSKHPTKRNTYLVCPTIIVPFEGVPPAKEIIFVLDTSSSMSRTRLAIAKPATRALIDQLIPGKDKFSVMQFDAAAKCIIPTKTVVKNDSEAAEKINNINAGSGTNIEAGLLSTVAQINKSNLDNTTIILLSDGEAANGETDPKLIVKALKRKLGDNLVRIIPIGIGTGYSLELVKILGQEAEFRGLIHLDDIADSQTAFTQVAPYLLPRTKPLTLSVAIDGKSQSEELGSIECNQPASTVFEINLSNGKKLVDTEVKCKVAMGKQEKEFTSKPNHDAEYDPEIIAKYYTQQYLIIVDLKISEDHIKAKLQALLDQLNLLNLLHLDQYQVIKDIKDKIAQTILSIKSHNTSAFRTEVTTQYTNYTRVAGPGLRTQISQKELHHIEGYSIFTHTLQFMGREYKAIHEDIDLYDIAKNGHLFVTFDAAIHNREAIIFDTQHPSFKQAAIKLTEKIHKSDPIPTRLDFLCEFVRNHFDNSDVNTSIKQFQQANPQHILKLRDGSDPILCVPLHFFTHFKSGICRHYAPLTASSIVHLIQNDLLPKGTVRILRGTADNQKAHSWVHYHPTDENLKHLIFLIDTTNPGQKVFIFDLKKIRSGEKDTDLENAIVNYRKRGLEGLLIEMLTTYKIPLPNIPLSENYQVSEELIRAIQNKIAGEKSADHDKKSKTEDALIMAGVIDPISLDIIVEPVRTDDDLPDPQKDKPQVYDRDFIAAWLVNHDTSPNTGAKLRSKTLTPAHDVVNRINMILAQHLGIINPEEVNVAIATYRQPELTEEAKLTELIKKNNKVRKSLKEYELKVAKKSKDHHAVDGTNTMAVSATSSSSTSSTIRALSATTSNHMSSAGLATATQQQSTRPIATTDASGNISLEPIVTAASAQSAPASETPEQVSSSDDDVLNDNGIAQERNVSQQRQRDANDHWFKLSVVQNILTAYTEKRGFKLFGYSSDASLKLIHELNRCSGFIKMGPDVTERFRLEVNGFLADKNNKGKRLYDILIGEKIKAKKPAPQEIESNPNYIWLDEDVLYLIKQKYEQQRGFKFFGYSCDESLGLLNELNGPDNKDMAIKQFAIENYMEQHKDDVQPKRLYNILLELKNMCLPEAPLLFSEHPYTQL